MSWFWNSSSSAPTVTEYHQTTPERSLAEQVQALTTINAKLQSELYEQRMLIRRMGEIMVAALPATYAEQLRDLLKSKDMYNIYGW